MGRCRLALSVLAALVLGLSAVPTAAQGQGGAPAESPASAASGGAAPDHPGSGRPTRPSSRSGGGARFGVKPPMDPRIRRRVLARKRTLARRRAAARRRALARRRVAARRRALARRRVSRPAPAPLSLPGRFPIAGPHTILSGGGRFGADRGDHIHQGQDIAADEGIPVVAPVRGTISWRSYQRGGAGYYLVLDADNGRNYVFMHLRKGSIEVVVGDRVGAGRRLAEVGQTGHAEGPHLHFEVWVGGWQTKGGHAIDPLPSLRAWGG